MWSQRRGVLQAQRGPELPAEGDGVRRGAEGRCADGPPRAPGQLQLAAGPRLVPVCPGQGQPAAAALRVRDPALRAAGAASRALSLGREPAGAAGAARGRGQAQDSAQHHRHPPGHAAAQAPAPPEAAADAAAPLPQGVPAAAQLPHPHQEQVPRVSAGQQDRRSSSDKVRALPGIPPDGTKRHWPGCDSQVLHKVLVISDLPSVPEKHDVRGEVLKCHNKCTKEAPACRISFLPITKIRRTESVPSDINNPVDRPTEPQFGTLPKALTKKEHPPAINHLDSSSNPSSTTSSTPSSPAPFQSSNPPSATPPPNPSPMGQRDGRFNFPAAYYLQHRQQFIFPEIPSPAQTAQLPETAADTNAAQQPGTGGGAREAQVEEPEASKSEPEDDEDEVEDLPNRRPHLQGMIYRKPSQTSVYLQEWDIPFEQIQLGDPIGQGRWGKVYKGKWHGEVAIRLLEIDGNNQDHLKLFKKEVMNYRQTRHENVVLFMGACMNPPHLAIITSFCKGRTLHSFVRDPKISLDINKTRQIAQEIIKGMGYLHAKGIVHKDLKSKNVFYDNGKVVITDFGLFGISGVVQEGRRENELKLPHDWLCYLAPEIVREMAPGKDEDKLPFSKAADIYAFGTVWYELQAREWPFRTQPAEALIWQIGSGEGVRQVLATVSLGKEVNEILSACWAFDLSERPSFTVLMEMLEKLPKLNRRLSHPGHFWKSADINSSKVVLRFERFGLGILEPSNPKL
ncbi:kinase suppressor of Ras 1 isoform X6 [Motacilla alba alba]|uniref:kinase suppressor of Ras 1 isoform X6 n=1 Tax=Motacilla alba alba TaxID=1094192 RepID=UPI0018D5A313|nr:kinase suppressor of Ras 1 isoform X6 [Motacilla alba alba]XP_038013671.1 kinase suppressor of Ras 1 isoform X6 [Motacilla alba alba]